MKREHLEKESDELNKQLDKAHLDHQNDLEKIEQLTIENCDKRVNLREKEDEIYVLKRDISQMVTLREGMNQKLKHMEDHISKVESARESLHEHTDFLERGLVCCVLLIIIV